MFLELQYQIASFILLDKTELLQTSHRNQSLNKKMAGRNFDLNVSSPPTRPHKSPGLETVHNLMQEVNNALSARHCT